MTLLLSDFPKRVALCLVVSVSMLTACQAGLSDSSKQDLTVEKKEKSSSGERSKSKETTMTASGAPKISTISPRTASSDPAEITKVTISGSGFSGKGLSVLFSGININGVRVISDKQISFELPKMREAPGEAPPMVLGAGSHFISIQTEQGTSNIFEYMLQ